MVYQVGRQHVFIHSATARMASLDGLLSSKENTATGKGWIVSLITHICLLALLCIPMLIQRIPPPESEGLLVNLGLPDQGEGTTTPKGETDEVTPEPAPASFDKPSPPVSSKTPDRPTTKMTAMTSTEDSPVTASTADTRKKAEADARKRQQEEEAARQQAAYQQTKKTYGDLFGSGGKGNTGKPGSQGDPNGDPNSNILEGISRGSGRVGGGLGSRGVLHEPTINDRSQKTGIVVISVCVDKNGKVIKADYTQRGSTTTDSELKEIARKAAQQFKFTPSDIEEQCGTITVDFKVRG